MTPSLSDKIANAMTSIMMITMVGIGKSVAFFRTCLTENSMERIEHA
jgi:hypothetical protein